MEMPETPQVISMKRLNMYLIFTLIFIAFSCQEGAYFEKNESIANRNWNYNDTKNFPVHIDDIGQKYDLFINVRHTSDYTFSNLFLQIFEEGKAESDTTRIEIKLAELDGRWTGKKKGDLYEHQITAKENFSFRDTGIYVFRIEQNMRENPLLHINDVGVKLVKK